MCRFGFDRLHQHFTRFVAGHAGNLLQLFELFGLNALELVLFLVYGFKLTGQLFVLAVKGIALFVERFFALDQAAFELLGFVAALLQLAVGLAALAMDLVLRFEDGFALFGFSGLDGFVDDACRFCFSGTDLFFRNAFAVLETDDDAHNETHNTGDNRYDDVEHCFGVSSLFVNFSYLVAPTSGRR